MQTVHTVAHVRDRHGTDAVKNRGALRGEGVRFFGAPDRISHGDGINVAKSARIAYNI